MEYLIVFRSEDRPAYHQVSDLDEALRFVEHLRNVEGVDQIRLHRLQEIPLEFRPYYKAEVGGSREPEPVNGSGPANAASN